jgi:hypothetical protein
MPVLASIADNRPALEKIESKVTPAPESRGRATTTATNPRRQLVAVNGFPAGKTELDPKTDQLIR